MTTANEGCQGISDFPLIIMLFVFNLSITLTAISAT